MKRPKLFDAQELIVSRHLRDRYIADTEISVIDPWAYLISYSPFLLWLSGSGMTVATLQQETGCTEQQAYRVLDTYTKPHLAVNDGLLLWHQTLFVDSPACRHGVPAYAHLSLLHWPDGTYAVIPVQAFPQSARDLSWAVQTMIPTQVSSRMDLRGLDGWYKQARDAGATNDPGALERLLTLAQQDEQASEQQRESMTNAVRFLQAIFHVPDPSPETKEPTDAHCQDA